MMRKSVRIGLAGAGGLVLWGMASGAWAGNAGGTIDYGPLPTAASVPTLGEWSLVLMALLVMVVAYRAVRGRVNGRLLTHLLLGGGLAAGGLASGNWVQSVQAMVQTDFPMTVASGGTVTVTTYNELVTVTNTSAVPLKITRMQTSTESMTWVDPDGETPRCEVGTIVQAGAKCYVKLYWPV